MLIETAAQLQDIPQGLLGGLIVFVVLMAILWVLAQINPFNRK